MCLYVGAILISQASRVGLCKAQPQFLRETNLFPFLERERERDQSLGRERPRLENFFDREFLVIVDSLSLETNWQLLEVMLLLCQLCLLLGINGESDYGIVTEWLCERGRERPIS